MGRIAAVLEEEVSYGFEGGPGYQTVTDELDNGFEERDSAWKYARHEFSASFENIDEPSRDYIIAVFHTCRGKRHAFMFKDWNDYKVEAQPFQVLPGTSNKVQLYKTYMPFGPPYVTIRPLQAIKTATIRDENGDAVTGTLNALTGEFTPAGAWGTGDYTLDCEFYVWTRFDADYNPMTINSWRDHSAQVDLVEDKFKFDAANLPESWEE